MFTRLSRLSIVYKQLIVSVLGIVLLAFVASAIASWTTSKNMRHEANDRLDLTMALAWATLGGHDAHGSGFRVVDGRLLAGDTVLNGNDAAVDSVHEVGGSAATIFLDKTRIATTIRNADGSRAIGTELANGPARQAVLAEGRAYRGQVDILGKSYLAAYDPIKGQNGQVLGVLYVGVPLAAFAEAVDEVTTSVIAATALATLVVAGLMFLFTRATLRPLNALTRVVEALAAGNLEVEVGSKNRRDEMGAIANALEVFRQNARDNDGLRKEQDAASARAVKERTQAVLTMADTIEHEAQAAVGQVAESSRSVAVIAEQMAQLTEETRHNASSVAAAAEETQQITHTVAAAAEQLSASSDEVRRQITEAGQITRSAVDETGRANATIGELVESSQRVGTVVGLIRQIAEQTNLLALNATIEAARAGEAGRGFAVVAGEVKVLATQTARATEEIAQQIAGMNTVTQRSAASIRGIGDVIARLEGIAAAVALSVEEQTVATREIANHMQQNSAASHEVTCKIAEVSRAAETSKGLAGDVQSKAHELAVAVQSLGTTLNRIVRGSTEDADRRQHPRHPATGPATVVARGQRFSAEMRNLSEGGAALAVRGAFSLGDRISFEQPGQRPVGAIVVAYAQDDGILQLQFAAEQAIGGTQPFAVAA